MHGYRIMLLFAGFARSAARVERELQSHPSRHAIRPFRTPQEASPGSRSWSHIPPTNALTLPGVQP